MQRCWPSVIFSSSSCLHPSESRTILQDRLEHIKCRVKPCKNIQRYSTRYIASALTLTKQFCIIVGTLACSTNRRTCRRDPHEFTALRRTFNLFTFVDVVMGFLVALFKIFRHTCQSINECHYSMSHYKLRKANRARKPVIVSF